MVSFNYYHPVHKNQKLDFNKVHMDGGLSKVINTTKNIEEATHILMLDIPMFSNYELELLKTNSLNGKKIVAMTFDPYNFLRLESYINMGIVHAVVVFDKKFSDRFKVPTIVSDYFFNEDVFPTNNIDYSDNVCIFGHLSLNRINNFKLDKVDKGVNSYEELYSKVKQYNGVAVYDTGYNEHGTEVVTYNKAKAVETLMCGRIPYCKSGINTINYNDFIKTYDEILVPSKVHFKQSDIFEINKKVLNDIKININQI